MIGRRRDAISAVVLAASILVLPMLTGCGGSTKPADTGSAPGGLPKATDKVTQSEINDKAKEIENSMTRGAKGKEIPDQLKKGIAEQAKRMLEQERAIIRLAEEKGVKVSDKDIQARLDGLKKAMAKTGGFDKMLKAENKTEAEFKRTIALQMLYEALRVKMEVGIKVKDAEVKTFYEQNKAAFKQNGKTRPFAEVKEMARRMLIGNKVAAEIQQMIQAPPTTGK